MSVVPGACGGRDAPGRRMGSGGTSPPCRGRGGVGTGSPRNQYAEGPIHIIIVPAATSAVSTPPEATPTKKIGKARKLSPSRAPVLRRSAWNPRTAAAVAQPASTMSSTRRMARAELTVSPSSAPGEAVRNVETCSRVSSELSPESCSPTEKTTPTAPPMTKAPASVVCPGRGFFSLTPPILPDGPDRAARRDGTAPRVPGRRDPASRTMGRVSLIDDLTSSLGPGAVLTDQSDVAAYCTDWRGTGSGRPLCVVRPSSTAEVSATVRRCHEAGVAVVPHGGGTGLSGGALPDDSGTQVVLSLARMRQVRSVDAAGDTVTVEAGVVLAEVQAAAEAVDRLFPLSLGSEGSCTIGGNLATNAGGTAVLRYGMARELVLGLEVVLPDGRVWNGLRPLRKDNTGYDLTQLFVGSEGTLGVITAATLRLFPATPRHATAWLGLPSVEAAVSLLPVVRARAGGSLTTYELVSREALDTVLRHVPAARDPFGASSDWYALVELAGAVTDEGLDPGLEAALTAGFEESLVVDAVVAGSPAQRESLWLLREGISEAQNHDGASLKHDVSVPVALLPDLLADTAGRLDAVLPGVRLVTYGHVGDGNVHHNLAAPAGGSDDDLRAAAGDLADAIYDAVTERGGSISAEHGLGTAKRDANAARMDPVELDVMRSIKHALDPAGLMNPGKVLPS